MTSLIYTPNGKVKINEDYEQSFKVFAEHCTKLDIKNPIVEGEYFKYLPSTGLTLIDRVGNEFFVDDEARENLQIIIDNVYSFIQVLIPVTVPEIPLIDLIPQLRRDFEDSIITINNAEFIGDSTTRASLSEAIRFLEELGELAPETIPWSAEDRFVDLSLIDLKNIALQIGLRRQKAFAAQKLLQIEVENQEILNIEEAQTRFIEIISSL